MKKSGVLTVLVMAMVAMSMLFTACTEPDRDKILKTTNALYLDIKTIVTDPAIQPMISPASLEKLSILEVAYLSSVDQLKLIPEQGSDTAVIDGIAKCADGVIAVLNDLILDEKNSRRLAAVRLGVQVLRNHL